MAWLDMDIQIHQSVQCLLQVGTGSGHHCLAQCPCGWKSNEPASPTKPATSPRGTIFLCKAPDACPCPFHETIIPTLQGGCPGTPAPLPHQEIRAQGGQEPCLKPHAELWGRGRSSPEGTLFPPVAINSIHRIFTNKINLQRTWIDLAEIIPLS